MKLTVLDFETYFDTRYSLKKLSIPEYVHDPRFHVHGIGIGVHGSPAEFRTDVVEALRELQDRFGMNLQRTTVVCHNAAFDLYVLNTRYGIRPRSFIDTMLLAYHVHGRLGRSGGYSADLDALAERYGLPRKSDLALMSGLRQLDVQQMASLAAYCRRDLEITAELAVRLLPQITRPEVELPILMHTVRLLTEGGVRVDVQGIACLERAVREQTQHFLREAGTTAASVSANTHFSQLLETAMSRTGRKVPLKSGKKAMIPATAKNDAAMQNLVADDDPVVAALARARLEIKGEDQKLARLDTLRRIAKSTGGQLPVPLVYYGSHTGRFAGGGGFNIQNLGRSGLGLQVRHLLVPRSNHLFVIGDLSQIEARITAWLAGQHDMVSAFRDGRDIYSEFASQTLGREVRKLAATDSADLKKLMESLRQVGKQAVLGLGFGMGALTYLNRLRVSPQAAGLFDSGELTPLVCRQIVSAFRAKYSAIPQFWADLEQAVRKSAEGRASNVAGLRIEPTSAATLVWLPCGRALRYADLRLEHVQRSIRYLDNHGMESEFTPTGDSLVYGHDTALYGGKLSENVVQAIARDILVEAVLRLERRGLRVVFHVHDEIVLETPQEQAQAAKQALKEDLTHVPPWAIGLPIACEVEIAARYGKS